MADAIKKINQKLEKKFGGRFIARAERQHTVLEGESGGWSEIVAAGHLAAKNNKGSAGLVNGIHYTGEVPPARMPEVEDDALEGAAPDVLVIGGGIIGCAIARELTRLKLDVLLIEKECDVALHASSRNDGVVHPGLDLIKKKKLKYQYNHRGNALYDQLCKDLQVAFERRGQYIAFPKKTPNFLLRFMRWFWKRLGVPSKALSLSEAQAQFPGINEGLEKLLFFPTAAHVCPYGVTIALAENAIQNGAKVSLNTMALSMETEGGQIKAVRTNRGTVRPRLVINAAGTFSEDIAAMAGDRFFSIHPRRGTNTILDKKTNAQVSHETFAAMFTGGNKLLSSSGQHTKGGGIVLTAHRNLLLGPDAVETPDREDFSTHPESIQNIFSKQNKASKLLHQGQIITYFTGVRAPTYEEDFVVRKGLYTKNLIHAAGMQSPGVTAAPAVAEDIAAWTAELLNPAPNENFNPVRPAIINAAELPELERGALIRENPDYGVILCRCEQISRGEILAAMRRPLPCDSVDGIKRRVRAGMGRCQGGFCGPQVAMVIAEELHIPLEQVRKSGRGSEILFGSIKEGVSA